MPNIGPYETIGEPLGQGGMGIVYKALQPSVNRVVALKVLPERYYGDVEAVERFRREGQSAANLNHPNIVKVWDASLSEPPYYIALQYLERGNLQQWLAQAKTLPLEQAVRVTQEMCSALGHAHQCGVVHRDVKPANIMFDAHGRAVLTDFGIVRQADMTRLTMEHKLGTPDYMSPEQAKGLPLDQRSDGYSLAVVLYEMVTGRTPFTGDPLVVLGQVVNQPVPTPTRLRPELPKQYDAFFARALAKDPSQRFQSSHELAAAVAALPTQLLAVRETKPKPQPKPKPVRVRQPRPEKQPDPERTPKPVAARLPMRKTALFGIVLIALAGAGGIGWRLLNPPPPPPQPGAGAGAKGPTPPPRGYSQPAPVQVPVVEGRKLDDAEGLLKASSLICVRARDSAQTAGAGEELWVKEQDLKGDAPPGSTVVLTVVLRVKVPDVAGMPSADAKRALEAAHLTVATKDGVPADAAGQVQSQSPKAGDLVPRDSITTLTLSTERHVDGSGRGGGSGSGGGSRGSGDVGAPQGPS